MSEKQKIELEYLLKTSVKVFENLVITPSGLAEWFADDVNIKEDIFNFHWDGSDEAARLIQKKAGSFIRWQWIADEEEGLDTYFEIAFSVDQLTNTMVLKITDFALPEDNEEVSMFWGAAIQELKRVLGA